MAVRRGEVADLADRMGEELTAAELARRRREIAKVPHSLGSRWPECRAELNELSKLTGP